MGLYDIYTYIHIYIWFRVRKPYGGLYRGAIHGIIQGSLIRIIKGDTRSLDYSSCTYQVVLRNLT